MDAISGAASISQLLAYSASSVRYLYRVYTELHSHHSIYHNEQTNVRLLLDVIKRVSSQNIDDSDSVLPILVGISDVACEIINLLQSKTILGVNWVLLTSRTRLSVAFEALEKKRRLLHLYVSQASNDAIRAIQATLDRQYTKPSSLQLVDVMGNNQTSTARGLKEVSISGNTIEGVSNVYNGFDLESEGLEKFTLNNTKVSAVAIMHTLNKSELDQGIIDRALQGQTELMKRLGYKPQCGSTIPSTSDNEQPSSSSLSSEVSLPQDTSPKPNTQKKRTTT